MFSSLPNTSSIASRLALLFTTASAVLVACALGIFYWLVTRHTFEEDNAALADKVAALRQEIKNVGPIQALQTELHSQRPGEHSSYWVRVIDPTGYVLAERTGMSGRLPPSMFPPTSPDFSWTQPVNYRTGRDLFSLVSSAVQVDGAPYLIQVAQDRTADENFNRQAALLFLSTLAVSIAASAIIARTTARRGLQPLDQMSKAFRRIRPTRLHERVGEVHWPRELQPLAEAFDQMLARLEESFTRLSQFSADLAHELRTPIANMMGEAQVVLTRNRPAPEYREVIESTVVECERLSRMADSLLFLARAESAREQINRTTFDGRDAIEKIANFYRTIADDRNVIIECQGQGNINADALLFNRAVSNLIDNAMRFTPDGGTIGVAVSVSPDAAKVSVSDTGRGIAPKHIERVFDRFYTADPSRRSAGAGLGLALVKSIIELHGGSVNIQSKVGEGTNIDLIFPNASALVNEGTVPDTRDLDATNHIRQPTNP